MRLTVEHPDRGLTVSERRYRRVNQQGNNRHREVSLPISEALFTRIDGMSVDNINRLLVRIHSRANNAYSLRVFQAITTLYGPCHTFRVFECVECGTRMSSSFRTGAVCGTCHTVSYACCNACGNSFHRDNLNDSGTCDHCEDEHNARADRNCVSGYHEERRHIGSPMPYYIGCELEVHAIDSCASVVSVAHDRGLIAERDGSLCGRYGIELVQGTPMALADTVRLWQGTVTHLQGLAEAWTRPGYGFHVSICTRGFTHRHLARICAFYDWNEDMVQTIGGRRWCSEYARKPGIDEASVEHGYCDVMSDSRYCAVALRDNDRLEIRSPRSNLGKHRIAANIQLLHAVATFTRDCDHTVSALTDMCAFWEFVHMNTSDYSSLIRRFSPTHDIGGECGSVEDRDAYHTDEVCAHWNNLEVATCA